MPITVSDLKNLASELAVPGATEAQLRASISRSYYAAFHSLLPFASMLPPSATYREGADKITHHEMQCRMDEWKCSSISAALAANRVLKDQVTRALRASRLSRVKADYNLDMEVVASDAQMQIERARRLIRGAEEVLDSLGPVGVVEASG